MRFSRRIKVLIYVVMNISTLFYSALATIQEQKSLQEGLIIYLIATLLINLLFWYVFRLNDKWTARAMTTTNTTEAPIALSDSTEGPGLTKVNRKVLVYVVINISLPFVSAYASIQGHMSIQRGLIIYLASAFWINLLLWYLFRMSDRRSGSPQA
jgi:hypothetical protein